MTAFQIASQTGTDVGVSAILLCKDAAHKKWLILPGDHKPSHVQTQGCRTCAATVRDQSVNHSVSGTNFIFARNFNDGQGLSSTWASFLCTRNFWVLNSEPVQKEVGLSNYLLKDTQQPAAYSYSLFVLLYCKIYCFFSVRYLLLNNMNSTVRKNVEGNGYNFFNIFFLCCWCC